MATTIGSILIKDAAVGSSAATAIALGSTSVWQKEEPTPVSGPWLCFTATEANSSVQIVKNGTPTSVPSLETSTDGSTWTNYPLSAITTTDNVTFTEGPIDGAVINLTNVGDKVYFRAKTENSTFNTNTSNYYNFTGTGKFAASGNIQSLLKADCSTTSAQSYCFARLFDNCTSLTTAPELPATTLATNCYQQMFRSCSSLTTAPELPATTLANHCYTAMFSNCSSLTAAPELPATNATQYCYITMFSYCTSLTDAPALSVTTFPNQGHSCDKMFQGCTSLSSIEVAFTSWPINTTNNWLSSTADYGIFKCPTALGTHAIITRGPSNCPEGWTVENTDA